jgi:hypothetical protein
MAVAPSFARARAFVRGESGIILANVCFKAGLLLPNVRESRLSDPKRRGSIGVGARKIQAPGPAPGMTGSGTTDRAND